MTNKAYHNAPPKDPGPRVGCRLCYRKVKTHGDKLYEVKGGQYVCIHDMAAVVQLAGLIWPDVVTYTRELEGFLSA